MAPSSLKPRSKCVTNWESLLKLLHNWYYTPNKLTKIFPKCWRGCGIDGTPLYIWWECPYITTFWHDVNSFIAFITGISVISPQLAILGIGIDLWTNLLHSFITHVLITVRFLLLSEIGKLVPHLLSSTNDQ